MAKAPSDRNGATFDHQVVGWLTALVLAGYVAATLWFPRTLWGIHSYAFLPRPVQGWAIGLVLVALLGLVLSRFDWVSRAPGASPSRSVRLWRAVGIAGGALALFWIFRIRHTLLGDAHPLTQHLPLGMISHPRQPLAVLLHHFSYELGQRMAGTGRTPSSVAFDSVAAESALAGVVFVWVAWLLGRDIVSTRREGGANPWIAIPVSALLLTQGYMLLFFGYVENYTLYALAIGLYLLAGLRFLQGRAPFLPCVLALVLAVALDLAGAIFLPSLAVLAVWGLRRSGSRLAMVRDLAIGAVLVVGLDRLFTALGGDYNARQTFRDAWYLVARGEGGSGSLRYLLTAAHLRDVTNVQLLIGPFAAALLLPLAAHRLVRGGFRDPKLLYLLSATLPALGSAWLFAEPPLGFPRDWDLFSSYGVAYVTAAGYCLAIGPLSNRAFARLASVAAVVSLFHLAPWVALNTSESLALERFKTLPRVRGREEYYVGYWYLTHNDRAQAREWFERAVEVSQSNNAAQYYLGLFAVDDGHFDEGAARFMVCVEVRPSVRIYRMALVDALVLGGHPDRAIGQVRWLVKADPGVWRYWAAYGVVLSGIGRPEEARRALARALDLAPGNATVVRLLEHVGDPDAYARAVREDWDALVTG